MNHQQARTLTEKFFRGETTLAEERQLYSYYASADVADDLHPMQQMFRDMAAINLNDDDGLGPDATAEAETPAEEPRHAVITTLWRRCRGVAAIAVVLVIAAGALLHNRPADCEMMVYGKRYTSREAVMSEVHKDMNAMTESLPDVDNELKDAFGM